MQAHTCDQKSCYSSMLELHFLCFGDIRKLEATVKASKYHLNFESQIWKSSDLPFLRHRVWNICINTKLKNCVYFKTFALLYQYFSLATMIYPYQWDMPLLWEMVLEEYVALRSQRVSSEPHQKPPACYWGAFKTEWG